MEKKSDKKLNIIYDASWLSEGNYKGSNRSGIFFATLNIFDELNKKGDVDLIIYCSPNKSFDVKKFLNIKYPNNEFSFFYNNCCFEFIFGFIEKYRHLFSDRSFIIQGILYRIERFLLAISQIFVLDKKTTILLDETYSFLSPMEYPPDIITKNEKIKIFLIVHDTLPFVLPDYFPSSDTKFWFWRLIEHINSSTILIANSNNTKKDFMKFCPNKVNKNIYTVYHSCGTVFKPTFENKDFVLNKYHISRDKKYVFSLCTLEPRKNLVRIIKTFIKFVNKNNINDLMLVLGGGHWDRFYKNLQKELKLYGNIDDFIIFTGYIDDEDLPVLYSQAEWFIYTSQYEGFGVPLLEAMKCGCPVISSNSSSLPEVVGDAGVMIDWDSDIQHIEANETYYYDKNLRRVNAQKGLERAKMFSWEKATTDIVKIIKSECLELDYK